MKHIEFKPVDFAASAQDSFVGFNKAIHADNASDLRKGNYLTDTAYLQFRDQYVPLTMRPCLRVLK